MPPSPPPSSWLKIQQHAKRAYLLDQLLRQLVKDLGLSAQEDLLRGQNLPEALAAHLAQRAQRNPRELYQLCYRVDLSEARVAEANDFRELAWLIVEREAQKVLLREQLAGRL